MNKGLNKVMIIGLVDGDPEIRHAPNGRAVASFSIATLRSWVLSDGERREETDWFNVVAWGDLAELCAKRLLDGHQVYVEGRLQSRGWEDSNGRKHFRTEVVAHDLITLSNTDR